VIRAIGAGALVGALLVAAHTASAAPQITAGATVGVAGNGDRDELWRSAGLSLGLRGELLLLRDGPRSIGLGPYVEALTTTAFSDGQLGAGVSALLPVWSELPIVVSMGAYERRAADSFDPGLAGAIFIGSRSYNYHGWYAMGAGLLLCVRGGLREPHDSSLIAALDIDLELLALPFLMLLGSAR